MILDAHNITTVIILLYTYRYSQDTGILSDEQRTFYEQNGYLVIKELVSASDLQVYKDRFQMICSSKVKPPGMVIMRDVAIAKSEYQGDERAVTKIQDFQYDEVFFQYFHSPAIIPYVTSIIGGDIMNHAYHVDQQATWPWWVSNYSEPVLKIKYY